MNISILLIFREYASTGLQPQDFTCKAASLAQIPSFHLAFSKKKTTTNTYPNEVCRDK